MNSYLDEKFPKLKIEKPLFYNWPIGLRFEIGQDELEVSDEYFNAAHERSVSIFEAVFSQNDEIEIIYQQYSDGRKKIRKGSFIFKQIIRKQFNFFSERNGCASGKRNIHKSWNS